MSINGITSNGINSLAPSGFEGNYLTPDALMSFCATRLRNLDDQVQTAFAKQKQANADTSTLSELQRLLGPASGELKGNENISPALEKAGKAMIDAANKCQDPETKKKLMEQASKLGKVIQDPKTGDYAWGGTQLDGNGKVMVDGQGRDTLTAEDFKHLTGDAIEGLQKDINAGTELSMINLQSLMSQRQSSVQLITNLVQSLGDQINKVAGNVGH